MNRKESLYHFVLEDNATIDEHVNPVSRINEGPSIMNRKGNLTFHLQATRTKLICQTCLVCGLKQSRAKRPVHLNRRIHDNCSDVLDILPLILRALRVFAVQTSSNYAYTRYS